jgi:hypothetical protein
MSIRSRSLVAFAALASTVLLSACPAPGPWPTLPIGGPVPDPAAQPVSPPAPADDADTPIDGHPPMFEVPIDMSIGETRGSGRAIMIRLDHTPDPQSPHRVTLEKTRVYVRHGDVGPISVTTYDYDGAVIDTWQAPDPISESAEAAEGSEGRYGVPYSKTLAVVVIRDERTGASVDVKVDDVIRNHCVGEPTDTICRAIDLSADAGLDHYDPRNGILGEAIAVPVHVSIRNNGTDWADVGGSMEVFGILDGVSFSTADATSFDVGVLNPTEQRRYDLTYTLTCLVEGDHRVFVGARWGDPFREAVDANPSNDHANTYFDVRCDPAP